MRSGLFHFFPREAKGPTTDHERIDYNALIIPLDISVVKSFRFIIDYGSDFTNV